MIVTAERMLTLLAIVEQGSFSLAAKHLNKSTSAVSQVIAHLETDLGIELFHRISGKPPELTDAGRSIYLHCLEIIPRLESLETRALAFQRGQERTLRMGIHPYAMTANVTQLLQQLVETYPAVELKLLDSDDFDVESALVKQQLDIIIRPAPYSQPAGVESAECGSQQWRLVASAQHPLASVRGELTRLDLNQYIQIIDVAGHSVNEELLKSIRFGTNLISCVDFNQRLALLRQGVGYAVMPDHVINPLIDAGELVALRCEFIDFNTVVWPVEVSWLSLGPAGSWFVEQLTELHQHDLTNKKDD
ncbi:LysR family transcriptional regulator [Paraferrimonas haliotis]|uniref:LysR family transcriptional regulator n=1 Tax=Paraferrimonas haliotis TaxID=2013866 RepID=A0AA37WXF1_9GAMM|nr:LysR family transcriptional regulator [Paraferrimonas haliotis]GLS84287.1 LysR family transcriptional regulator [Paraferrimonas haliotis]